MLSIGRENSVPRSRIIAIIHPESSPVKKLISSKREENHLIDATRGKKTRSVILMDNGYLILSSITSVTLSEKYEKDD